MLIWTMIGMGCEEVKPEVIGEWDIGVSVASQLIECDAGEIVQIEPPAGGYLFRLDQCSDSSEVVFCIDQRLETDGGEAPRFGCAEDAWYQAFWLIPGHS